MVMLYHYTDYDGLHAILESGFIRSSRKYGHYGRGVYLTAIRPQAGTYRIMKNNYDDDGIIHCNPRVKNRASYFVKIHSSYLEGVSRVRNCGKRNIYLYDFNIDLDDVDYEIGETTTLKWSRCLYDDRGNPDYIGLLED